MRVSRKGILLACKESTLCCSGQEPPGCCEILFPFPKAGGKLSLGLMASCWGFQHVNADSAHSTELHGFREQFQKCSSEPFLQKMETQNRTSDDRAGESQGERNACKCLCFGVSNKSQVKRPLDSTLTVHSPVSRAQRAPHPTFLFQLLSPKLRHSLRLPDAASLIYKQSLLALTVDCR